MCNPVRLTVIEIVYENAVSATLRTNSVSIKKTNQLMLFKEMMAVFFQPSYETRMHTS
jgi:hypothetical protein